MQAQAQAQIFLPNYFSLCHFDSVIVFIRSHCVRCYEHYDVPHDKLQQTVGCIPASGREM
jgi:hypothetical protein